MATANIIPTAEMDGVVYASSVPLTITEASLGNTLNTPDPIPIVNGETIVAVVKLTVNGQVGGNNAFVFMQTDLGDGTWIDVAWCFFNNVVGTATFVLCGGGLGAMNNAFQQSRNANAAPATQANGSNAVPLGGRVRFTGWCRSGGSGSSSISGQPATTLATITYRVQRP